MPSACWEAAFDEITVQRINLVEPDGTLRMVLSDKARIPGLVIRGKEYPREDRQTAGMLFFNDEGTENGRRKSGVAIWDRGDYPITQALEAMLRIQKLPAAQRAYLGRSADHSVGLRLMDQNGRDRIRIRVNADGSPVLEFLNADGKLISQLPSSSSAQ